MHTTRSIAIEAALEAGRVIRGHLGTLDGVDYKGEIDIVTAADHAAEEAVLNSLWGAFPDFGILAEESGAQAATNGSSSRWVVDPLDGTTNFATANPHFAVSIALERDDRVVLGVIYDPMLDELFIAERGRGATVNGKRLAVSRIDVFLQAMLSTGFPYDVNKRSENLEMFTYFTHLTRAVRRVGAAALDLCYVAAGRYDGFWEAGLKPWDSAAGSLVVLEAGGMVTDYQGQEFTIQGPNIVASNGLIHDELLDGLQRQAGRAGAR
ncbi:MAG: inositol monophosphatase family protein [Thermomicrobiaceae bacterium]